MELDTDNNGSLDLEEFRNSTMVFQTQEFVEAGSVEELFRKIDTDNSGTIEYSEFITAAMDRSMQLSN